MAHHIEMSAPSVGLLNKDVEFHAHAATGDTKQVIGRLKVSKGGVEWVKKNHSNGIKMTWTQFAKLMESQE